MAYTTNATELVYNLICEKIQNMEWKQGNKIWTEQKFCIELGVSRVAVRSAIDKLVTTSILRKVQGSGTYVQESNPVALINVPTHQMTDQDILDIIRFRIYFEPGNVIQFLKYGSEEEMEHLEKVHHLLMDCDKSAEDFFKYDFEFHRIIAAGTKNIYIEQVYLLLTDNLVKNQERLHEILGPEIALKYHPVIMEYIKKKDSEVASLIMKRHLEETAELFEKHMLKEKEKSNGYLS